MEPNRFLIPLPVLCLLVLGLQACGGGSGVVDTTNTVEQSPPVTPPSTPPPAPAPSEPLAILHSDFYPPINSGISYSQALSLAYEASKDTLSYGDDSLQFAEYWQPINTERKQLPAIILVHGGCWSNQFRIDQTYPAATAFSLNGFHVWSVEYRAVGDEGGGWPGTADDVQNAIVEIRREASTRYAPREHIIIGHSAGGHLGLLALSNLQGSTEPPLSAVGVAAITNIVSYANPLSSCGSFGQSFMGGSPEDIPDEYNAATPDFEVLMDIAFLYASSVDNIAPLAQATFSGLPFVNIEDAGHFDWIHPGTPAFDGLMDDLLYPSYLKSPSSDLVKRF